MKRTLSVEKSFATESSWVSFDLRLQTGLCPQDIGEFREHRLTAAARNDTVAITHDDIT
jgi:hypothetical protein